MRICLKLVLFAAISLLASPQAKAKRVALIIGVGEYEHLNDLTRDELDFPDSTDTATTPTRDASAIEAMAKNFGFTTILRPKSGSIEDIKAARESFLLTLEPEDEALFFFSGHGLQKGGDNYLLGSDANLTSRSSRSAFNDAGINVTLLLNEMSDRAQVSILFLDACRTELPGAKSAGSAKGFTFTNVPGTAGNPSFIGFAAEEGTPSFTGNGELSFYTEALVEVAQDVNYSTDQIERFHDEVRRRVAATAQRKGFVQKPSYRNNMQGADFRMAALPENPPAASLVVNDPPTPLSLFGSLQVMVNVPDANILIDGALVGSASSNKPLNQRNLLAGEIDVLVQARGYQSQSKRLRIEPDNWLQERFILLKNEEIENDAPEESQLGKTEAINRAQAEILIASIERDIEQYRLTSPAGNNAKEKLARLAIIDPENTALNRLNKDMIQRYTELAQKALKNKRVEKAARYIRKIQSLDSTTGSLVQLEQELNALRNTTDKTPLNATGAIDEQAITRAHLSLITKRFHDFGVLLTQKKLEETLALVEFSRERNQMISSLFDDFDELDFSIRDVSSQKQIGAINGRMIVTGRAIQSTEQAKPVLSLFLTSTRNGDDWSAIKW